MTTFETDPHGEPTHGLALLSDPLGPDVVLPPRRETELRFEQIVNADRRAGKPDKTGMQDGKRRPGRRPLVAVAASVAALAVVASLAVAGGDTAPAAALTAAIDQTEARSGGTFTVDRVLTADDRTLTQTGQIIFDGENYTIRYDNIGGIIDPASGVTPPSIEFREVDGVTYIGTDRGWVESVDNPTTHPMRALSARLAEAAAVTDTLERCPDQTAGTSSFCLTTDDPALVAALQPGLLYTFERVTAAIRVEVDDATGHLARIAVEATDVVVSQPVGAPGPGPSLPTIDSLRSETSFGPVGSVAGIEVPHLTPPTATGQVPWQCDGLQHSDVIVECLEFYGEPELAQHFRSLDLEPMDPPPPGAYGPVDAPFVGADG